MKTSTRRIQMHAWGRLGGSAGERHSPWTHLRHGAKRDMKLKVSHCGARGPIATATPGQSITQWGGGPQLTMPWQSSADQTEKKHADIFSRAREGEAACERDTGIKNRTVVSHREQRPHSGVEGLSDHAVAESQRPDKSPHGECNALL